MSESSQKDGEQSEMGLFMDLTPLDELERKITGVIERYESLRRENEGLREQLRKQETEIEKLKAQCEESRNSGIDSERENLIRQRIQALLVKLEAYNSI